MAFAPHKYELIHFTTARKRHNLRATIKVGGIEKEPSQSIRVLGVWLDPKLSWRAHAKVALKKGLSALSALGRVVASTWGASFSRARLLYCATVRPAISYGATAWLEPGKEKSSPVIKAISKLQSRGLRLVAGAYKATPIRELEKETFVPPIDIYCKEILARHIRRTYASPAGSYIQEQCRAIVSRLGRKKRRKKRQEQLQSGAATLTVGQERLAWAEKREQDLGEESKKATSAEWGRRWVQGRRGGRGGWQVSLAKDGRPRPKNIKLYSKLKKAESSAVFQARTGRIGLRHFLAKARVPEISSPECSCGHGLETAEHVLLHCKDRPSSWPRGTRFRKIMEAPECVGQVARDLIQCGRLGQFSLANKLLYS
jgi:hypothetical protein